MDLGSEEEFKSKLQKLEDLYSKGKISESTYLELRRRYTKALKTLEKAPKAERKPKIEKKVKRIPLGLLAIAIALIAVAGVGGFILLHKGRSPTPTPTTTPSFSPSPTPPPSPTPSPTVQPTPTPQPQGVPLSDVIASVTEEAKRKCFKAYPIMASTGLLPYEAFQPEAIGSWVIKFYCPWRNITYQYLWDQGEISFDYSLGEVVFSPKFTPLELKWNVSPAQAMSIALEAGGRSFIESQSKPVRVIMHLLSKDLAIHQRMIPKEDEPEVTSDYVWIVVFSTGGLGKKYKVYINAETGTVLKAIEY